MSATRPYVPDTPEAKLWELLRRNRRFRRTVARMQALLHRLEDGTPAEQRNASQAGRRILDGLVRRKNPFGELALQWLVPQPWFVIREAVVDADPLRPSATTAGLRFDSIEWGTTPDPADPGWRRFKTKPGLRGSAQSQANHAGWPLRWGPQITTTRSLDSRIHIKFPDDVREWREWFSSHTFTVETPWKEAPPLFQRHWKSLWSQWTGFNQSAEETNFFQDWSLPDLVDRFQDTMKEANKCIQNLVEDLDKVRSGMPELTCPPTFTQGGITMRRVPTFALKLSDVEQTRLKQFFLLEGLRAIALPPLLTKQSVTMVLKKVANQLAASLPSSRELLATPRAWEVFVEVDSRQNPDSRSRSLALRNYIKCSLIEGRLPGFTLSKADRDRWIRDGTVLPVDLGASLSARNTRKQILRNLNQAYGEARRRNRQFERWVTFVDELVEATFPTLEKNRLMAKTPS